MIEMNGCGRTLKIQQLLVQLPLQVVVEVQSLSGLLATLTCFVYLRLTEPHLQRSLALF